MAAALSVLVGRRGWQRGQHILSPEELWMIFGLASDVIQRKMGDLWSSSPLSTTSKVKSRDTTVLGYIRVGGDLI